MNNEGLIYQCIVTEEAAMARGDMLGASVARQQGRELSQQPTDPRKGYSRPHCDASTWRGYQRW